MFNWGPEVANKALILHFHHIQTHIECFFLGQEHLVDVNCGRALRGITLLTWDSVKDAQLLSE